MKFLFLLAVLVGVLLVIALFLYWIVRVIVSARKRKWNDFFYSLSILLIMCSGIGFWPAMVLTLVVIGVHSMIASREDI